MGWVVLLSSAGADGAPSAASAPASAPAATKPAKEPDWFDCLKDIPLGPGKLDVGGSIRTRYELLDDFTILGVNTNRADEMLLLRSRISLDYKITGQQLHFFVEAQDARFWLSALERSDFAATHPHLNQADLRQAFVEWRKISGTPFGFKIGRQSITYADKRIFGPGEWGNTGRYQWDAGKFYIQTDAVDVDLLYGRQVQPYPASFDDEHYDYDMVGVYAQIKKLPVKLDVFYLLRYDDEGTTRGEAGLGDRRTHTMGFYVDGKAGGRKEWDYGGTVAFQAGQFGRDDLCAYGLNSRLGYTFDLPWQPRLGFEFSYASGDRDPTDGRHETFDNVFGAVDTYYGRMNLFSWMNLEDYQLTASVKPAKDVEIRADYHLFRLATDNDAWYFCNGRAARRDPAGDAGQTVGHEIDLLARWKINRHLELYAGYAHFFDGGFVDRTAGGGFDADWLFAQLVFSF